MKFLQFFNLYEASLEQLYQTRPGLEMAPAAEQAAVIRDYGFSSGYIFAPHMAAQGYEPIFLVANNYRSQLKWAAEHGAKINSAQTWELECAYHQVEYYKPDVLFITEPLALDTKFLRHLSHRPKVVMCWRAAPIPPGTDWSGFDLLLTNLSAMREMAIKMGVKHTEYFWPGFDKKLFESSKDVTPDCDLIFCGQVSHNHAHRNEIIKNLAVMQETSDLGFTLGLHLSGDLSLLPSFIQERNRGARFGVDYYRALRSGKISLDVRGTVLTGVDPQSKQSVDLMRGEHGTARTLETTGVGRLLLTGHSDSLGNIFKIGEEVETYRSFPELLEKARFFAHHDAEREAIAARGQQRCFREHSLEVRAAQMDEIIKRLLK